MSQYCYSPLPRKPDSIRLLRLMPNKNDTADIQCKLFKYALRESDKATHPYEALSYVWGGSDKPKSIFIGNQYLAVTLNLHAALLRLRDHNIPRIIWVDAVCINQEDEQEKEHQIQSMAKIYGKASRVIVWLGERTDDSDVALEAIRVAGKPTNTSNKEMVQQAILLLLQRPWFRRIWVLQEVAAARYILILCGPTEIDGYAFCSGLELLKGFHGTHSDLLGLIHSITYLIRGAIFRPKYVSSRLGRVSLDICPLGELIDMYHTHEATERHDKIYALLGMSSDDISAADLSPNYQVSWKELLQRLVKFLLGKQVSVKTWIDREMAIIDSKGYVLGQVSSVKSGQDNRQNVNINFKNTSQHLGHTKECEAHWNPVMSAVRLGYKNEAKTDPKFKLESQTGYITG